MKTHYPYSILSSSKCANILENETNVFCVISYFKNDLFSITHIEITFFWFARFFAEKKIQRSRACSFSSCKIRDTILRGVSSFACISRESQFRDSTFLDSQEESTRILFLGEPNQCSMRRCCWSEIDNKGKLMNHDFLLPVCTYKPVTCICSGI